MSQVNPYVASAVEGWRSERELGTESTGRGLAAVVPRVHGPTADLLRAAGSVAGATSS